MTPTDRELSLYAKIEKLEWALEIAKEALEKMNHGEGLAKVALEKIEKELW